MKARPILILLSIVLSIVIGLISYEIAPDIENRQWISLGVTSATTAVALIMTMGFDYQRGNRNVNIVVTGTLVTLAVVACNFAFGFFVYPIVLYIAITLLIEVIGLMLIYLLAR